METNIAEKFISSFMSYARYLGHEVLNPHWGNYFYWLIIISIFVYALELIFPWRKGQSKIRKDFYLDLFYMFFNFFIFGLIGYAALSDVVVMVFNHLIKTLFGIDNLAIFQVRALPYIVQLLIMFIVRDFIQWNVHRLLHYNKTLWQFHKVHHSVEEMGFAAHLRYHFMETLVYRTLEYIPLALIGFGIQDFILVHLFALLIGHLNHANLNLSYGPLKYILNNPKMHIWHHAKNLPENSYGINFGISLSIWDYIFKTAKIPHDGRDIPLGFEDIEKYPRGFWGHVREGFKP